ncbi:MAG: DUF2283 domain-containing protein [Actinomycetota bacterium]|nr:DUF2283 domain-containing protein [Thermoleophilia bacterium]MDA3005132.1 DUF2283 domain-containing protein [Actinomycetota bacterium]
MKALYDSEAHAMYIDVVDPPCWAGGGADDDSYPVLHHYDEDDRLVGVEILSADTLPEAQIVSALAGLELDVATVVASWRAALAAPDREVVVGPALPV